MADSKDKIRSDIAKLKERLEEVKRDRVARGLPAERPDRFVPPELGFLLKERNKHIFDFIVKYAKLCDDAGEIISIDTTKLNSSMRELKLVGETINGLTISMFSMGVLSAIKLINNPGELTHKEFTRQLLRYVQLAKHGIDFPFSGLTYDGDLPTHENRKKQDEAYEKYQMYLNDEVLLNGELKSLYDHYESIKHLY
jgi:hypothetical protein